MPDAEVLSSVRERIASLQVLSCRLVHERVVIEQGVAKRRSQGIGIEPIYVRNGLCSSEFRSRQLSCAHTMARDALEKAVDVLEQQAVLDTGEALQLRADLQRVSHTIHMTDWTKSDTEVRYALLVEQGAATASVPADRPGMQDQLDELIGRHQEASDELRGMHRLLLERLDAALADLAAPVSDHSSPV